MANKVVTITGMTGVGKDFLVERANQQTGLPVLNFGTLMGETLGMNRDQIAKEVDPTSLKAAQLCVADLIVASQPAILISHVVFPDNTGGLQFAHDIEARIDSSSYVFVTAPPDTIATHVRDRNAAGERASQELDAAEIDQQQLDKLTKVQELCGTLGANLIVVENTVANLETNVSRLAETFAGLRSME